MEDGKLLAKPSLLLVYKREVGLVCMKTVPYMSPLIHILECNHLSVIDLCTVKNSVCATPPLRFLHHNLCGMKQRSTETLRCW